MTGAVCGVDECGVVARGRCARCKVAFCLSHQGARSNYRYDNLCRACVPRGPLDGKTLDDIGMGSAKRLRESAERESASKQAVLYELPATLHDAGYPRVAVIQTETLGRRQKLFRMSEVDGAVSAKRFRLVQFWGAQFCLAKIVEYTKDEISHAAEHYFPRSMDDKLIIQRTGVLLDELPWSWTNDMSENKVNHPTVLLDPPHLIEKYNSLFSSLIPVRYDVKQGTYISLEGRLLFDYESAGIYSMGESSWERMERFLGKLIDG